jgi:DNA repair exonuclease SbcCD nuclease subunit
VRILLVSDVHLDAQFAWAQPEVARRRRQALRDSLVHAVELSIGRKVDAICCGGDLFEHDRVSPDTGQFLRDQFERASPIPVFIAPGNHDWLGPQSLYRRVRWSSNVHLFEDRRLTPVTLTDGLTLWGAAHVAPAGTRDFLDGFRVDRAGIHLALFHGSELGSLQAEQAGKQVHAPFRVDEIERSCLHFALLGHYHAPRDHERFTYPGNPEPLTFGESGARGVVIATIDGDGRATIERHCVAVSEVHDLRVDISGCASKQDARERVAAALEGRTGYARLTLFGELDPNVDLHLVDFADLANSLHACPVVRFDSVSFGYDLTGIAMEPTVRGQFVRDVQAAELSDEERRRVVITGLRALDGRDDLEVF